ncbi:MAG: membrane-bound lytic murein transglycosylase MltC [Ewingella americana]|jgi:membrane-bound lytic murein transglycosylase C|uniref:Membrane-bound lytic murein transglycosylase C n=2 Tax=Ewingella americana TaxID=41202 RepID=A0A085G6E6_EWIA3|nr:membrane-bound lytic murein transglycosylase MltC [Ewingella americana]KAA8727702.1 membrane-bound lytic murein transglycosylase MltC [Ewingella americana]KFC79291.1 membrane-bound lytic murein transglycosylase C [Ewingella americana ATCC 33852]MCI1679462.1 membrane-bound lytic murein transglycosylase MltC [Ewingella americana]MCI1854789.1 membrane-bound lytic murein transglycosylase MltC [Ewingella americana]MCI1861928.1 membrane-bound lytic murein transglycosylase MltC [Ewingella american
MKKILALLVIAPLLISCSSKKDQFNEAYVKDTNGFDILMGQFAHNIENIWGLNEVLIAGPKDYVKYSDQYYTRSHINFDAGTITIETIAGTNPTANLRQAIISTLLVGDDPGNVDLYSDANDIQISKEPMLYGQVLDNTGQPIRWQGRASNFADYLVQNKLQRRQSGLHIIYSVTIQMVPNHLNKRAHKYLPMVREASAKYGVDQSLILAIMQTESAFNPYAVSHADALGLMQVVQHSAGVDVFKSEGKWGKPSRSYLFDPQNNINTGTAYLAMLQNVYLGNITNPTSRRYAVITAYNGGAGSVLRVFSSDKNRAFSIINSMEPGDVYTTLTTKHPSGESRRYLYKVNTTQKSYRRVD